LDIVEIIAENKIREAIKKGELKNLAGEGEPLKLEDLSGVPEDLRVPYLILKNAGMLPPELELKKEIVEFIFRWRYEKSFHNVEYYAQMIQALEG